MIRPLPPSATLGQPERLPDLRLAVVASEPQLSAIARTCSTSDVTDSDWQPLPGRELPHLLLIESSGLRQQPSGSGTVSHERIQRALKLISWADRSGIPTVLWETGLSRRLASPRELMDRTTHLFVADPEAVHVVAETLGGRRPILLPLAAQVVPDVVPGFNQRSHEVVFLGRWAERFSGGRRDELELILDAARARRLTIFQREGESREENRVPERFAEFVVTVPTERHGIEAFQDSRVVIGIDPRNHGRLMVPQVAFDGTAAGAVVITPNHLAIRRLLGNMAVMIKTAEGAEARLARYLDDEAEWQTVSTRARNATLHGHVYANRLATIASAAGFRLLPEPERAYALTES
jgi:hypothetical protein